MAELAVPWWIADRAAQFRLFAETDGSSAPLYARLAVAAADDPEILGLLDAAPAQQQRMVLLFAAVHFLVLGDPTSELARFYPSVHPDDLAEGDPWPVFRAFCLDRRAELEAIISTRNTQTNEVGRCAAIVPALEMVYRDTAQPLSLLEVGASSGLNLGFDRYRIEYSAPSWSLPPWPPFETATGVGPVDSSVVIGSRVVGDRVVPLSAEEAMPPVADRAGLDLFPGDVTDPDSVRWLEACIFPDRLDRLDRLRAAVALSAEAPPRIEQGDAVADLARVASTVGGDGPLVVFHSWALTYVEDKDGFAHQMRELSDERDVWWLSVEPSTAVPGLHVPSRDARYVPEMGANTVTALMHLHAGARTDDLLARSHPHLDWLHWLA